FARCGARVIAVGRREALLEQLVNELPGGKNGHRVVAADLASSEGVQRLLEIAAEEKAVDIVVNNAGVSAPAPPGTVEAVWQNTFDLQFHAPRLISEALLDGMATRGYGRIILAGAIFEPWGMPNASTSAKAA